MAASRGRRGRRIRTASCNARHQMRSACARRFPRALGAATVRRPGGEHEHHGRAQDAASCALPALATLNYVGAHATVTVLFPTLRSLGRLRSVAARSPPPVIAPGLVVKAPRYLSRRASLPLSGATCYSVARGGRKESPLVRQASGGWARPDAVRTVTRSHRRVRRPEAVTRSGAGPARGQHMAEASGPCLVAPACRPCPARREYPATTH